MTLELSPTEVNDLRESLLAYGKILLLELARADDRHYREMLRDKLGRYEALSLRVEGSTPSQPQPHA